MNILKRIIPFALAFMAAAAAHAETVLEPFSYRQDFESREECAWASYPLWQDTAFDPNFRVDAMVPGDPNISIAQKVTPYSPGEAWAGAHKKFDAWMTPGSSVSLRYYLKSHRPFESLTVRIAAGPDGALEYTVKNPPVNRWQMLTFRYEDLLTSNPRIEGRKRIRVNALAVLAVTREADPAIPLFFGLDDVVLIGARMAEFRFATPAVHELAEWKTRIARDHYLPGGKFELSGTWPFDADRTVLSIVSFTDRTKVVYTAEMRKSGGVWTAAPVGLSWPPGMYLATLAAYRGGETVSDSRVSFVVATPGIGGKHPRLWFDSRTRAEVIARLTSPRFKSVDDDLMSSAASTRKRLPLENVTYTIDQYPDEDAMPTWDAWVGQMASWNTALYANSLAWSLHGDREAGLYARDFLVKVSSFPGWDSPWMLKRGRYSYLRNGEMYQHFALAYDLVYDLMDAHEAASVRAALLRSAIKGTFRTYVDNDMVTNDTSNWISHVIGGALMCHAAVYGDGPETSASALEPAFSGAVFKLYDFISANFAPGESYGEGMGYYNTAMRGLSRTHPAIDRVFNLDFTHFMDGTYREVIWGGIVADKRYFHYGDSGNYPTLERWAWLLGKKRDPLLGWFYNYMKRAEDFVDVLFETADVPRADPYRENPVRVFRATGTAVFKSGWGKDDFAFVLRSGPFINHQHLDQGSFWLADRGTVFIEERHGSSYYSDPLYQPWYTQPAAHSTILVDRNLQSQRTGDPLVFADGFADNARIGHFLDGSLAAFTEGDIGRLYKGAVKGLVRNVLYLKPRTLLMLDTAVPAERDREVNLLYQTERLADIAPGGPRSAISKGGNTLHIVHLFPETMRAEAVETPHYLSTLRQATPLEKEGMLMVSARTSGLQPLVMANLLAVTPGSGTPDAAFQAGNGFVAGKTAGLDVAFSTRPGSVYTVGGITTDAVAVAWKGETIFAAKCTELSRGGKTLVRSESPMTCEIAGNTVKYYRSEAGEAVFGDVKVHLSAGEGTAAMR